MSNVILSRIENFKSATSSLSEAEKTNELKNEVKKLVSEYKATSVRRYLTLYRKNLNGFINGDLRSILTLPQHLQNKIENSYTKKVVKQQKKLKKIKEYQTALDLAKELLSSEKWFEVAVALCLLTGRRSTEILKTAKFTNVGNSKKKVFFKGQLKSKGLSKEQNKYQIYILGDSKNECKNALKKLRSLLDCKNLSNEQTVKKYNSQLNNTVRRLFSGYLGDCTAHDLRKAYATICTKEFKDDSQTVNSFLASLMGHSSDDLTTANSYQKYYIK